MSLVKYKTNDYTPLSFTTLIDEFFNDSMTRSGGSSFQPRVDIVENDLAYELHVAAPGVNKDAFQIDVRDNVLSIGGERKFSSEKKETNYHSIETQFGAFSRSFTLPENVDSSKINAVYNNGILELTIPKDAKKSLKTTIKVN